MIPSLSTPAVASYTRAVTHAHAMFTILLVGCARTLLVGASSISAPSQTMERDEPMLGEQLSLLGYDILKCWGQDHPAT